MVGFSFVPGEPRRYVAQLNPVALLIQNDDGTCATTCSLCDEPLSKPIFGTSHFIHDESDRLYAYSGAGMHWDCYAAWKYQKRFANQYFEVVTNSSYKNPYWPTVLALPNVNMRANCDLTPPVADIDIRAIGPGPRVELDGWADWLDGGYRDDCSHSLQLSALDGVIDDLRSRFPTYEAILLAAQAQKTRHNNTMHTEHSFGRV